MIKAISFKEVTLGSQVEGAGRGHHTPWVRGDAESSLTLSGHHGVPWWGYSSYCCYYIAPGIIHACLFVHCTINKNDFNIQKLAFNPLIPIQVN